MGDKDGGESKCGGETVLNGAANVDVSMETRRKADVDGPQSEGLETVRNGPVRSNGPAEDSAAGINDIDSAENCEEPDGEHH